MNHGSELNVNTINFLITSTLTFLKIKVGTIDLFWHGAWVAAKVSALSQVNMGRTHTTTGCPQNGDIF